MEKPKEKRPLRRPRSTWENNNMMELQDVECDLCTGLVLREVVGTCESGNKLSGSIKCGKFLD
jgi:hypothetical protein